MNGLLTDLNHLPFNKGEVSVVGGYYDLVHSGHLEFLQACKAQAQGPLLVLLNDDESCRKKSKDRPIIPQHDRAKMLLGMSCVDYVFICSSAESEMKHVFKQLIPKRVFFSIEKESSVAKDGQIQLLQNEFPEIEVVYIPRKRIDISTTDIIEKITRLGHDYAQKKAVEAIRLINLDDNSEVKGFLRQIADGSSEKIKNGAFIADDLTGEVIAVGHNSVAKIEQTVDYRNINTYEYKTKAPRPMHAEIEALCSYVVKGNTDFTQSSLYTLFEPCAGCAQVAARLGVKKVRYFEDFDNNYGTLILNSEGVDIKKFN